MSMHRRDIRGGALVTEQIVLDESGPARPLGEIMENWLLEAEEPKKKEKTVKVCCYTVRHKVFIWTVGALLFSGFIILIAKAVPSHHHAHASPPNNYTLALHKALMFFNAQRSGKLPKHNNVSWRGNSCMQDGKSDTSSVIKDLVGGFYDGGDAIKFHYPQSFAMTMLSWSVIEYSAKYEAASELKHVKELIRWGNDYFLKTFGSTADTIDRMAAQVGIGHYSAGGNSDHVGVRSNSSGNSTQNDHYCWMRPEDIDYMRPVTECHVCSDLAAEMAASLASASIVFKDDDVAYSEKLVHGAKTLFKFSRDSQGSYSPNGSDAEHFYNSTSYWDEYIWGASWLYFATGNHSYLQIATDLELAAQAGTYQRASPNYGVFSWDNKLPGAQLLLSRLRLFLNPGYPYEEGLRQFHNRSSIIMCSYLPVFTSFNRTKGGLIELNHGAPRPLQYVVNAAFLATLFTDYLEAADITGWDCGPKYYSIDVLRNFAKKQMNYILGDNPQNRSYVVGFGDRYPKRVHHRGASIPKNKIKYNCKGGWKWRDSTKPNPNILVGAMVAGPDRHDGFHDVRRNYNYTEPTLAGNAGLVAALVALSGDRTQKIDVHTMFSAVPNESSVIYSPPPWEP